MNTEILEQKAITALDALKAYSSHPSAFLALNEKTTAFFHPPYSGFIAYRAAGAYLFQMGSIYAPKHEQEPLLQAFLEFAQNQRKRVCALQLRAEDIKVYRKAGFRLNQLGRSFSLSLDGYRTKGAKFRRLRNKVSRAQREGLTVVEFGPDVPLSKHYVAELEQLTAAWLRSKGRFKKLLDFMIGELGGPYQSLRRVFIAVKDESVLGFISYVPVWGELAGYHHDLSRRRPDAPPGVMELINVTAIKRFQDEGASYLHFGLTPFLGCGSETDLIEGRSPSVSWLLKTLATRGGAVYPALSQAQYKLKWQPDLIAPEYVAYQGRFRLGCLFRLLKLTRSL